MTDPGHKLRARLAAGLVEAMATHSPLSAKLAEEAGFDALWASGFELSALYGLADVSLISMTQHLDMVRAITGCVSVPVIADIDTGFGNAINVIHAVREYERAGAAAVVIEDKQFPKVTSLIEGGRQHLVSVEEFQGKIAAAVAARTQPGFVVIARTEALIAGRGQQEALVRGRAYAAAGADLVVIHSKSRTSLEIETFCADWTGEVPLVVIPTAYPDLTATRIRALGKIGMVIYGNHAIRAATTAMRDVFARIRRDGGIQEVDRDIVTVEDIFHLQEMAQIREEEARFLR